MTFPIIDPGGTLVPVVLPSSVGWEPPSESEVSSALPPFPASEDGAVSSVPVSSSLKASFVYAKELVHITAAQISALRILLNIIVSFL